MDSIDELYTDAQRVAYVDEQGEALVEAIQALAEVAGCSPIDLAQSLLATVEGLEDL